MGRLLELPPKKRVFQRGVSIFHNRPIIAVLLSPSTQIFYKVASEAWKYFPSKLSRP